VEWEAKTNRTGDGHRQPVKGSTIKPLSLNNGVNEQQFLIQIKRAISTQLIKSHAFFPYS
jgi:hypothetical protein